MKVGVNLVWLETGVVGGSEGYLVGLLEALDPRRPADLHLRLYAQPSLVAAHPALGRAYEVVTAPVPARPKALRVLGESTWLPWQERRDHLDLVHHPGGHIPFVAGGRAITTIHDVQWLTYPEHFSSAKRRFLDVMVPLAVRRARRILVPSGFVRATLVEQLGAERDRVDIVSPGAVPVAPPPPERLASVRRRYHLGCGPVFLYPAIVYPHKNHVVLVRALAALGARLPHAEVIVTGGAASDPSLEHALDAEADRLGVASRFRRVGRVPDDDLDALYRLATALVFPSRYEGFGTPVLEAWSRDVPVLAADVTALSEVVRRGGVLLPADDPEAWADAMWTVALDPDRHAALVAAGRARLARYSPASSAASLVAAYRTAAT